MLNQEFHICKTIFQERRRNLDIFRQTKAEGIHLPYKKYWREFLVEMKWNYRATWIHKK